MQTHEEHAQAHADLGVAGEENQPREPADGAISTRLPRETGGEWPSQPGGGEEQAERLREEGQPAEQRRRAGEDQRRDPRQGQAAPSQRATGAAVALGGAGGVAERVDHLEPAHPHGVIGSSGPAEVGSEGRGTGRLGLT